MNRYCSVCGAEINTNTISICPSCGSDFSMDYLSYQTAFDMDDYQQAARCCEHLLLTNKAKLYCDNCGGSAFCFLLKEKAIACVACGRYMRADELPPFLTLGNRQNEQKEDNSSKALLHDRLVPLISPKKDDTWRCECGYKNESYRKYCTNCDLPRKTRNNDATTDTWVCSCGFRNNYTSRFCWNCYRPR